MSSLEDERAVEQDYAESVSEVIHMLTEVGVSKEAALVKGYEAAHELIMSAGVFEQRSPRAKLEIIRRVFCMAIDSLPQYV